MDRHPLRPLAAWYEDVTPGLLTNRTIRNFLEQYSQQLWPDVIKLAVIHGIVSLLKQYPGQSLSLQQLRSAAEQAAAAEVVDRSIPKLQRQILDLQERLDGVYEDLSLPGDAVSAAGTRTVSCTCA